MLMISMRLITVLLAASYCIGAAAADNAAQNDGDWDFQLSPLYYWSLNIGGEADTSDSNPPIDLDTFGLNFKGAFSLNFDARYKDRWGFIFDTVGVRLSSEENDDDNLFLDLSYTQADLAAYYRLDSGKHAWDLLAGGRYYRMDVELEGISQAGDASWLDPFFGARWTWSLAEKWKLNLRGDVGGFGVGSDLVWQAWAIVDWFPRKNFGLVAGGRVLSLDYKTTSGDLNTKFTAWGPVLGFTFRW